ncbi:MAG: hypothetical protein GF320_10730 [Armatimonadia bacterium]|nr:hypothetical protein [Armatimonadia bacterium]
MHTLPKRELTKHPLWMVLGTLYASTWLLLGMAPTGDPSDAEVPLRLIYTTDTLGQIDTCGCSGGQHGGLSRRATLVRRLSEGSAEMIVLDGGQVTDSPQQAAYFAEAYDLMGYDLVLIDGTEPTDLEEALRGRDVPTLARPNSRASDPLPSHVMELKDGLRVIVLVAPAETAELGVLVERVEAACVGLERERTLVLLATRLDPKANAQLAELLGDSVDLVLGASSPSRSRDYRDAIPPGKAVLAISRGKALTVVDIHIDEDGGQPRIEARFEPVAPSIVPDAWVAGVVERYYDEAAPRSRPSGVGDAETIDYVMRGWADAVTCGECHPAELESWRETQHAHAIPTLARVNRLVDECLACHSEQYRRTDAFDPDLMVPGDGVTCATCHGDGLVHSMTSRTEYIQRDPGEALCVSCHNEERQPSGFEYEESWAKIAHGNGVYEATAEEGGE